jgi:hypothetical protein
MQLYGENFYKKEADGSPVVPAIIIKQTSYMGGVSIKAGLEF